MPPLREVVRQVIEDCWVWVSLGRSSTGYCSSGEDRCLCCQGRRPTHNIPCPIQRLEDALNNKRRRRDG